MNRNQFKFSVIIPTYNRAKLLNRCLESIVNQTYKNFEVIVCDDGSTDNSKEITENYLSKLEIKYIWDENWGGPARPRNNGIKIAKGEWICFLDSDDWWKPEKLESCLPYLDSYDLLYHSLEKIYEKKGQRQLLNVTRTRVLENNIVRDLLLNGNTIANSSMVVRKSILDKVGPITEDKELIAVEDFDYCLRIAAVTNKFFCIPQVLGYYWFGQNISFSPKQIERTYAVYDKFRSSLSEKDNTRVNNTLCMLAARMHHKNRDWNRAMRHYRKLLFSKYAIIAIISIGFCLVHSNY